MISALANLVSASQVGDGFGVKLGAKSPQPPATTSNSG